MELYQLEAFEAVVLYASFTRAAESLCVTQPAVTRQIAALEAELRTRLFDRLGRTVQLTPEGEVLHRYAESIVRLTREARQAVGDVSAGQSGRLVVGASSTLAAYVLPPILRDFRRARPNVEIAVHTGVSARVLEMVRDGVADMGLITTDSADRLLTTEPLTDHETCVVAPPSHPLAGRETVNVGELAGQPLILMNVGTSLRAYVDLILSAAGITGLEKQVVLELDSVEAIKRMVEAELGLSLLPLVSVRAEVETGRLAALKLADAPRSQRRITLVHRRDKYLSAGLSAFLALLRAELKAVS